MLTPDGVVKARELSGRDNLMFIRDGQTGKVVARVRSGIWGTLNVDLTPPNSRRRVAIPRPGTPGVDLARRSRWDGEGRRVRGTGRDRRWASDRHDHQSRQGDVPVRRSRRGARTKLDLARYYVAVGDALMPTVRDRPVLFERYPNGVREKSFFQKRIPDSAPEWLRTTTVETINGTPSRALVIADLAHVLWAVNMGVLGLHVWPFRASTPDDADEMRIDLDPSPGVTFDMVRQSAGHVRDLLAEHGMLGFPEDDGQQGHPRVRACRARMGFFAVRGAVVASGPRVGRRHPDLITDKWWKEERGSRVFVDFNQNAPHKNMFGAWGVRARVGAQVSTPFRWDELDTIDPETTTMDTVPDRLAEQGDPWELMDDAPCSITPLVEQFAADLADGVPDVPWPPVYPKMPNEAPRVQPSRARSRRTEGPARSTPPRCDRR